MIAPMPDAATLTRMPKASVMMPPAIMPATVATDTAKRVTAPTRPSTSFGTIDCWRLADVIEYAVAPGSTTIWFRISRMAPATVGPVARGMRSVPTPVVKRPVDMVRPAPKRATIRGTMRALANEVMPPMAQIIVRTPGSNPIPRIM